MRMKKLRKFSHAFSRKFTPRVHSILIVSHRIFTARPMSPAANASAMPW